MNTPDHRSSSSSSDQAPQHRPGALDEAQTLFKRMAGEATRQSALEREEARLRGPVARFLLVLTIAACLLAVATGLYGVYNFPDAPIRQGKGVYIGKGGKPHTQEEFEAFILWQQAMFIIFPSAFVLGFGFGIADAMQRRKRSS
jgi:hypothetical protein